MEPYFHLMSFLRTTFFVMTYLHALFNIYRHVIGKNNVIVGVNR